MCSPNTLHSVRQSGCRSSPVRGLRLTGGKRGREDEPHANKEIKAETQGIAERCTHKQVRRSMETIGTKARDKQVADESLRAPLHSPAPVYFVDRNQRLKFRNAHPPSISRSCLGSTSMVKQPLYKPRGKCISTLVFRREMGKRLGDTSTAGWLFYPVS